MSVLFQNPTCSSVLANLTSGVSYLRGGLGILKRLVGQFHVIGVFYTIKNAKCQKRVKSLNM